MSLTGFVKIPGVAATIKPLRPKDRRRLDVPLKVAPRSERHGLMGTAFDYLLRFELWRRAPYAVERPWVAEAVPGLMHTYQDKIALALGIPRRASQDIARAVSDLSRRARRVIDNAKRDVAVFQQFVGVPGRAVIASLAGHALRLAKLDALRRVQRFDPTFEHAATEDVENLVNLLTIAPFDQLVHSQIMRLNPTFGAGSRAVHGADGDLISGDMLLDFKTVQDAVLKALDLDQLFGYLLLARRGRQMDPSFPEIKRVGIYFSRHGYLWIRPAALWTSHPRFAEAERRFFDYARQLPN